MSEGAIRQLTDVVPRKREVRDTDSQKYLKTEEQKLIEYTRTQAEQKEKAEEKQKKDALPQFELQESQSVQDLALAPDGDHVFMMVVDRASGAKTADVPNYVTESAYTENISARTFVGDAQDGRRLAILNLKTGKPVWADASFAGKRKVPDTTAGAGGAVKETDREIRWSMPLLLKDGRFAVAVVRAADFKDRWIVLVDPESGKSQVLDALHDDAWVLDGGGGFGGGGGGIGEKHPGERHLYSMAIDGGERTQITSATGSSVGVVSPDDSTIAMVYSYTNKTSRRRCTDAQPEGSGGHADHHHADRGVAVVQVGGPAGADLQGARRRGGVRTALHARDARREA